MVDHGGGATEVVWEEACMMGRKCLAVETRAPVLNVDMGMIRSGNFLNRDFLEKIVKTAGKGQ